MRFACRHGSCGPALLAAALLLLLLLPLLGSRLCRCGSRQQRGAHARAVRREAQHR
jgi:hypothetical protein